MTDLPSFQHPGNLENEYLRTYVKRKESTKKDGTDHGTDGSESRPPSKKEYSEKKRKAAHFSHKRKAAHHGLKMHISLGKELTTKHVKAHIRENAAPPAHTSAQRRMERILSEKNAKKGAIPMAERIWFRSMIGVIVIANAVQLGVEVDYPEYKGTYQVIENIFTGIFSVEMVIKLWELRFEYFKDGWNLIDFVLVWLSILDCWILPLAMGQGDGPELRIFSMLRILRILRLLRAVRLFKVFNELWKIVKGILDSLRAVSWTALLLIFLLYICGVFCCVMVGKNNTAGYLRFEDEITHIDEIGRDFDVYQFYGTVPRAMYTLFETCIEPLNIRPVIERQPWMAIFFLAFIFISTFGVLNVIIGVIVQHTMSVSEESKNAEKVRIFQEKMDMLELVRDYCFVDRDEDGNLSVEEIQKAFENPVVLDTLEEVEMPLGLQPEELFDLLDANGNGEVTHDEMLMQLTRATVHNDHQQLLDLKIGLHTTQRQMHHIMAALAGLQNQMKYGFCHILPEEKMQSWPTGQYVAPNLTTCASNHQPQAGVRNADKEECSGTRESAKNNGADQKGLRNVKTEKKPSLSSQDLREMPIELPENDSSVLVEDQEHEEAVKVPSHKKHRRFQDEDLSLANITKGGCQGAEVKKTSHDGVFSGAALPPTPLPPGHLGELSTSSQQLPAQPFQAQSSLQAPTGAPPLLNCSNVEAPPQPPMTEVPLMLSRPGLNQPCDDPEEQAHSAHASPFRGDTTATLQ